MFIHKYFAPEDDLGSSAGGTDVADTSAESAGAEAEAAPVDMEVTIRQQLQKMNRTRDEGGRFAKTAEEAAPVAADETVEGGEPPVDTTPTQADTNPDKLEFTDNAGQKHAVNIAEPPMSWRADAKAAYAALPEHIRREVHKREHDFHSGVQQYKTAANFAVSIGNEFKPYEALLRSQNHTPQALTKDFMNAHYRLSTGDVATKASEIVRVAGLYNLSVQDLQSALANVQSGVSQPAPAPAPEYIELRRELDAIKNERTAAEEASIQEQIRGFETDGKHEYFKQVAVEMGALMSAGRANSMQDAYDKAIWANPEIRAKLLAKQQADQQKIAAEKAAVARKASSVNVPARGKHPAAAPMGSMEDTIRSTFRKLNGGE